MSRIEIPSSLSPEERSALLPIQGRARAACSESPILGDEWSRVVVDSLAVDWEHFGLPKKEASSVATRGRHIDDWCRAFLTVHPDGVVLDLGSGLDDRAQRVMPPAGSSWFDLDLPGIMALRRRLPERQAVAAEYSELDADAAAPEWIGSLPSDRPLAILADGFSRSCHLTPRQT